jgi:hypothetical protein
MSEENAGLPESVYLEIVQFWGNYPIKNRLFMGFGEHLGVITPKIILLHLQGQFLSF